MFGSISGSIIDSNDLYILDVGLSNDCPNALDRLANRVFFVVTRNDY